MEDVLDLYSEPEDPDRPRVCFDETPFQMLNDVVAPIPAKSGQPRREDYEYRREGTANLFVFTCPERSWRHVEVTDERTKLDFAHQLKALVDDYFPDAQVVRVVLDNLNIHTPAVLYEAFPAADARRIARKLEFHYTPKHGSWLNMAEIEISVLLGQCLRRRIPTFEILKGEIAAWERQRNQARATISWRFTTQDARAKFKHSYPA